MTDAEREEVTREHRTGVSFDESEIEGRHERMSASVENAANKTPQKPSDIGSSIKRQGGLDDGSLNLGDTAIAGDNVGEKSQDRNLPSHQTSMHTDDVVARRTDNVSSGSGSGSGVEPGFTSDKGASAEIVVSKVGEHADNEADETRDPRTGLVS